MLMMRCPETEKCLEIIHLVLDSEATDVQENYLNDHVEMCKQCLENFNIEKEIRMALKTRLERRKVPQDLIDSIKEKISQV